MAVTVRVDGHERLIRTMGAAALNSQQNKQLNREAAVIVAQAGTSMAPVKTGRLARSVRAAGSTSKAGVVRAGNNGRVKYAGVVHWGWPLKNIGANPWLYQAAVVTEDVWFQNYERGMVRILRTIQGA